MSDDVVAMCPRCLVPDRNVWDLGDGWVECPDCGTRFDAATGDTVRHG